eukprot:s1795_g7.t1
MEARNISDFPRELVARMTDFLRQRPIRLDKIEDAGGGPNAVPRSIDEEDHGEEEDEEEQSSLSCCGCTIVKVKKNAKPGKKGKDNKPQPKAAATLRPEDVPVPDDDSGDLDEPAATKPAKTKLKAAEQPTRLSRGQRKRQQRKENFLRKFELANLIGKQEEAFRTGSLANLADLTAHLDEDKAPATAKGPKRLGRKAQAAQDEREMAQFQGVLGFQAFQADPFGALEQHLKNSIRLQKEKEKANLGFRAFRFIRANWVFPPSCRMKTQLHGIGDLVKRLEAIADACGEQKSKEDLPKDEFLRLKQRVYVLLEQGRNDIHERQKLLSKRGNCTESIRKGHEVRQALDELRASLPKLQALHKKAQSKRGAKAKKEELQARYQDIRVLKRHVDELNELFQRSQNEAHGQEIAPSTLGKSLGLRDLGRASEEDAALFSLKREVL